ncbi:Villin headpiece [Sesbania bispinosa]|nr:Villin headpiece [Sesbania bispinosa]
MCLLESESVMLTQHSVSQDRLNGLNQGGPRQRAEALAALNSAFNSSSGTKTFSPRASGKGQGSQRAAAVAALSSVLTAEKKKSSPDGSPVASSSPVAESSTPEAKSGNANSEVEEAEEAKETEELTPETGSDGDLEPKQENAEDGNGSQSSQKTFSYNQLKTKSGYNLSGIDLQRREAYLSDDEFKTVFGMEKEAFYKLPRWKQDMLKRKFELF